MHPMIGESARGNGSISCLKPSEDCEMNGTNHKTIRRIRIFSRDETCSLPAKP